MINIFTSSNRNEEVEVANDFNIKFLYPQYSKKSHQVYPTPVTSDKNRKAAIVSR